LNEILNTKASLRRSQDLNFKKSFLLASESIFIHRQNRQLHFFLQCNR